MGHLSKSAEVMKLVNNLMKAPEVAATMLEFSKEMTKVVYLKFCMLELLCCIPLDPWHYCIKKTIGNWFIFSLLLYCLGSLLPVDVIISRHFFT